MYATCDISRNLVFELLYKNGLHKHMQNELGMGDSGSLCSLC